MAFDFKILLTSLIFVSILQNVCLVPIDKDLSLSRTTDSAILSYNNDGVYLVRVKKELVVVGWCSLGKKWYFGKCRTQKEYQRIMDNEYDDSDRNTATMKTVADPRKEIDKKVDAPDKAAVKTTMDVSLHTEYSHSTKNTTKNDFTDTTTEVSSTTVYYVDAEELQNTDITGKDDFTDIIAVETSTVLNDISDAEELNNTHSRFDTDTMGSQAISSTSTSVDKSDVNLERVKNWTFTLLMVGGGAVVLSWLFKLLYDYYLRKDDRTTYISCSAEELHDSASSRQRLCPRS